jgi:hypothetical protein
MLVENCVSFGAIALEVEALIYKNAIALFLLIIVIIKQLF